MLAKSDFPVEDALELLTRHDIDATLLVPTPTGLDKSIMDATEEARDYLSDKGFHDYASQDQGPEAKVVRDAFFVTETGLERTRVSLYRPQTKSGDPRIWLGEATRRNANPFNLLALVVLGDELYVANLSNPRVRAAIGDPASPFGRLVHKAEESDTGAVEDLLGLLREVAKRGYVKTLRPGDTGVGMTLETLLGIAANSSQLPDFRGIELKAKRVGRTINRSSLFSQVPDWKLSPVRSAMGLLERRGYEREGRLQLYHELDGKRPNSMGLKLDIEAEADLLRQVHVDPVTSVITHDVSWRMQALRDRLASKHAETFWVRARCRGKGEDEEFCYVEVEHTKQPKVRNLEALIEAGVISMDYTLSKISPTRARDHGYLFKIHPANLGALFPPSRTYALA
ncbi:MvaI/BcnI restriction endonuclease family protein [Sphingomonas rhizophila]|uniref:MvaI/BcnI restriction endonuclease family protein n=1 Tax=Sphingomonas rhizophila TaxID=2071607 RepID=A0A7G9S9V6_9SPHN|nr:MvaI/BcnI family restriction endonuclease [Sphingomonas rhizophila]QNN64631.1 MvaI/BcnI restriction endonuclease family protein [Sphingomonas rhizophila]